MRSPSVSAVILAKLLTVALIASLAPFLVAVVQLFYQLLLRSVRLASWLELCSVVAHLIELSQFSPFNLIIR